MTQQSQYLGSILPENAPTFSKTNISKLLKALHMLDFELFHCEEQSTPDMTLKVYGGRFFVAGAYKEFALDGNKDVTTTNSGTMTAPTTNPRIDLLYWDTASEALGITTGTEAATPAQPAIPDPSTKITCGLIYHRVGSTKVLNSDDATNSYIMGRNVRPFLNIGNAAPPSFSVHKNGTAQTGVQTGIDTKVTWNTEAWDTNSDFASNKFSPTIAGKYILIAQAMFNAITNGSLAMSVIYKNGTTHRKGHRVIPGADGSAVVTITTLVDANGTTDYFEYYVYQSTGVDQTLDGSDTNTFFQGFKLP